MEGTISCTLPLNLHTFRPNPFTNYNNDSHHCFKTRASRKSPPTHTHKPRRPSTHPHHRYNKRSSRFPARKRPQPFATEDGFPDSLPLHTKNPHAIYKDIQRFAWKNKLEKALTILDYLDQEGIPVNPTTFSSLIASCVRTRSLAEGKQVHRYIRINGLENNEFLRTKLVNMYMACGSVDDAQQLFDECSSNNVYSWNALLRGTVISGKRRYGDVLSTYTQMRELGVGLNVYTFSSVIKSFAGASALWQGLKTHALLIKNGLVGSSVLQTSLIDMYFKCGKIKLACRVFQEIYERDVVVWGAMIAGFTHNRLQREALEYVRRMVNEGIKPNSVILTTILPAIGEVRAHKLGCEAHAYVVKTKSYSRQIFLQSALIDMYCKCGDVGSGRRVFYGSTERNTICWTALMSGYAANGRLEQAMRSIVWMQQEGFRPDVVTIATVLPICAELRALKQGKEVHAFALKNWFLPNVSIVSSLMVMYSKCGILEYSAKLFDGMERRNVILWTAMIDTYKEHGYLNESLGVFRSMQLSKHRPDSVTMARILSVCGEAKTLKLGKEAHGQVVKKNFESIHFVSAAVVKMYGCCGEVDRAKLAFDTIPVKGSMTWTAIIEAYAYNNRFQDAMDLFDEMRSGGSTPNDFTFRVVLSICDQAGLVDEACQIFNLMQHRYKIKASEEHYSVIIGLLTRFGHDEEAQRFIQMSSSSS